MGQAKALLPVPPQGTPLVLHIIQRLTPLVGQVLVVANDPSLAREANLPASVPVLADRYPEAGTLGGIATGLGACNDWTMMVACDMPFLNPVLFAYLQQLAREQEGGRDCWDAVVPFTAGYAEPLHALYHRRCLPAIEARLAKQERRANCFYSDIHVRRVEEAELRPYDPQLLSFVNINTPEEWQQALRLFNSRSLN